MVTPSHHVVTPHRLVGLSAFSQSGVQGNRQADFHTPQNYSEIPTNGEILKYQPTGEIELENELERQ